jgi:gluconate 2-dehydrogenase gamma chain
VNKNEASRRQFLRASGGMLGATWVGMHWPALLAAAEHAHQAASGAVERTLKVLSPAQARDVEAIAAQIVPSDDTPGAREAGVVYFIDHVHAGPYAAGAPEFLAGLAEFQSAFAARNPAAQSFGDLQDSEQLAYLKSIEATPFFGAMKFLTVLGLLALPSYGGNAGKLGWQLVGFVDQHAWTPPFGHYDRDYPGFVPYTKEPQS